MEPTDRESSIPVDQCENPRVLAFEEIVRLYQRDVRSYVRRYLATDDVADDLAQEVFVEVYRSLPRFEGRSSLKTWIMAIARNRVGSWLRQQTRQIRCRTIDIESDLVQYQLAQWQDDNATCERQSQHRFADGQTEELTLLRLCLQRLKEEHRELVQRFYFEGMSAEAIGQEQGRNAGTIRMTLLRIRQALAKCIRNHTAKGSDDE
ncbi:MAG TPA: sigma-70 family RNA polymerase sigma factor [Pirellulaceae bacterium]|nr:sigma-70 family RNA polymerase sigma factor [Pirellulaceae bacterium]